MVYTSAGKAGQTALKSSYAGHSNKKCLRSSTFAVMPVLARTATWRSWGALSFVEFLDMEVNLAPHKTCLVVFRRPRARVPSGFRLLYRGCEVARQPQYKYLGVAFHETRGLAGAADALAAAGNKAMHALLTRCRRANLT